MRGSLENSPKRETGTSFSRVIVLFEVLENEPTGSPFWECLNPIWIWQALPSSLQSPASPQDNHSRDGNSRKTRHKLAQGLDHKIIDVVLFWGPEWPEETIQDCVKPRLCHAQETALKILPPTRDPQRLYTLRFGTLHKSPTKVPTLQASQGYQVPLGSQSSAQRFWQIFLGFTTFSPEPKQNGQYRCVRIRGPFLMPL